MISRNRIEKKREQGNNVIIKTKHKKMKEETKEIFHKIWRKIICEKNLRNLSQTDRPKICEIKK